MSDSFMGRQGTTLGALQYSEPGVRTLHDPHTSGELSTVGKATDVPRDVREHVLERDEHSCRVCGRWAEPAALHHIQYRSEVRNNHSAGNLVTVGYAYGHICHQAVHSNKRRRLSAKCFGIFVSSYGGTWPPVLNEIADDVRTIGDLTDASQVRDIMRNV